MDGGVVGFTVLYIEGITVGIEDFGLDGSGDGKSVGSWLRCTDGCSDICCDGTCEGTSDACIDGFSVGR